MQERSGGRLFWALFLLLLLSSAATMLPPAKPPVALGPPARPAAHHRTPPPHLIRNRILFAAQYYRRSGWYYQGNQVRTRHGSPEDEILAADGAAGIYLLDPAHPERVRRLTPPDLYATSPAWSPDGSRVVFVGTTYRPPHDPGEDYDWPLPPSHLYLVNIDGSGLRRLTFGKYNDTAPEWSPNSHWIAFWRDAIGTCVLDARQRRVRTLTRSYLPNDGVWRWAPAGNQIAIPFVDARWNGPSGLLVIDCSGVAPKRRFDSVFDASWSPDSARLYLKGSDRSGRGDSDRIVDLQKGTSRKVAAPIDNALWLDSGHLLGDFGARTNRASYGVSVRRIDAEGRLLRQAPLIGLAPSEAARDNLRRGDGNAEMTGDGYDVRTWRPIPDRPDHFMVVDRGGMSDGPHYYCYQVGLSAGAYRLIFPGKLFGFSPDGQRIAVADHQWFGPYKRGGRRVGPLEIVSLKTGRAQPVTRRLADITDAEWR